MSRLRGNDIGAASGNGLDRTGVMDDKEYTLKAAIRLAGEVSLNICVALIAILALPVLIVVSLFYNPFFFTQTLIGGSPLLKLLIFGLVVALIGYVIESFGYTPYALDYALILLGSIAIAIPAVVGMMVLLAPAIYLRWQYLAKHSYPEVARRARELFDREDYHEAVEPLSRARAIAGMAGDRQAAFELGWKEARAQSGAGHFLPASECAAEVLKSLASSDPAEAAALVDNDYAPMLADLLWEWDIDGIGIPGELAGILRACELGLGPKHSAMAAVLDLAVLADLRGGIDEQLLKAHAKGALSIRENAPGCEDRDDARTIIRRFAIHLVNRELGEAERCIERLLECLDARGEPAGSTVATCLTALGRVVLERGDRDQGMSLLQRALEILEDAIGPGDQAIGPSLFSFAMLICGADMPHGLRSEVDELLVARRDRMRREETGTGERSVRAAETG